jgi:hypothetical protein
MTSSLEPVWNDTTARWAKWKNPSGADACRIWGPYLEAVCLTAKVPTERATAWLQSQNPETLTVETVSEFVRSIAEAPASTLATARARQAQIEKEVSKPLTARERVLSERLETPLAQGHARVSKMSYMRPTNAQHGTAGNCPDLSRAQWDALEPHYRALEQELAKRDCMALGVPHKAPAKRMNANLSGLMPMRG